MHYRIFDVLKKFANFTGKNRCQEKCERKSLTLSMQPAPSKETIIKVTPVFQ